MASKEGRAEQDSTNGARGAQGAGGRNGENGKNGNAAEHGATHGIVSGGNADGRAALDFDDDEIYSGRSAHVSDNGTAASHGGDSGRLGPPSEQLSSSNGPSDPDPAPRAGSTRGAER